MKGTEVIELSIVLTVLAALFEPFFRVKVTSAVMTMSVTSPMVKLFVMVLLNADALGQGMLHLTVLSAFDAVSPV